MSNIMNYFTKSKPKPPKQPPRVQSQKSTKRVEKENRLVSQNGEKKGFKKVEPKQEFHKIEIYEFGLSELKEYQHKIEVWNGQDNDMILLDEDFLYDEADDPEKVRQMLKKKQERRMQMDEEEKKLSDNIKKSTVSCVYGHSNQILNFLVDQQS